MPTPSPRTTRCAISGAEILRDESFVLDLRAAYARLRDLRSEMDAVERVIHTLASKTIQLEGVSKREVQQRLTVSLGVAAALDTGATRGLFIPWPEHLQRQSDRQAQQMSGHPIYGVALRGLDAAQRMEVVTLGRRLVGRVIHRAGYLDQPVHQAISWAAATALRGTSPDEAFARLLHADEDQLKAFGFPASVCAATLTALRRCRDGTHEAP